MFSALLTARCEAVNKQTKSRRSWGLEKTKTYHEVWLYIPLCFLWMCAFLSLHCLHPGKQECFYLLRLNYLIFFGLEHIEMDLKGKHEAWKRASLNFRYTSYRSSFSQELITEYRPAWELRLQFGLEYMWTTMLSIVHLVMVLCGYHCHFQVLSM